MSFNNTAIPPFVLANFYTNNLVVLEKEYLANKPQETTPKVAIAVPEESATINNTLKYLGNNGQQISVVVEQPNEVYISDNCLALLTKMLSACKLTLNDVAIVNVATQPITIDALLQQLQPKKILLFNLSTQQLQIPFAIPNYKLQNYNGYTVVQAVALEKMLGETAAEKMEKKQLWNCLQQLFNLK